MNIYTDYVFPDKLISPVNGYICKKITKQNIKQFGFSSKEELLEKYPGFPLLSAMVIKQQRKASELGNYKNKLYATENRKKIKTDYENTPKKCLNCDRTISFRLRNNKFCDSSCAASYNNKNRTRSGWTTEQKSKSATLHRKDRDPIYRTFKVNFSNCKICNKGMCQRGTKPYRVTCSRECQIIASTGLKTYQNGRKKLYKYFNKHENKEITLESSYELKIAEFLDRENIKWSRPKFIRWVDPRDNKTRYYYPDFYLPEYEIYLDPKNSYVMKLDQTKLSVITKTIRLLYGNVDRVIEQINMLKEERLSLSSECHGGGIRTPGLLLPKQTV